MSTSKADHKLIVAFSLVLFANGYKQDKKKTKFRQMNSSIIISKGTLTNYGSFTNEYCFNSLYMLLKNKSNVKSGLLAGAHSGASRPIAPPPRPKSRAK